MHISSLSALLLSSVAIAHPGRTLPSTIAGLPITSLSSVSRKHGTPPNGNATSPAAGGLAGFWTLPISLISAKFTVQHATVPRGGNSTYYQANNVFLIQCDNADVYSIGLNMTVIDGKAGYNTFYRNPGSQSNSNAAVEAGDEVFFSVSRKSSGTPFKVVFENLTRKTGYSHTIGGSTNCTSTIGGWLSYNEDHSIGALPALSDLTIPSLGFKGTPDDGFYGGDFLVLSSQEDDSAGHPVIQCGFEGSRGMLCTYNN